MYDCVNVQYCIISTLRTTRQYLHHTHAFVCFNAPPPTHSLTLGISNSDLCADHCQVECTGQRVVLRPLSGQCFINHKVIRKVTRLSQGHYIISISSDWLGRLTPVLLYNAISSIILHLEFFHQIKNNFISKGPVCSSYRDPTRTCIVIDFVGDLIQLGTSTVFRFNHPHQAAKLRKRHNVSAWPLPHSISVVDLTCFTARTFGASKTRPSPIISDNHKFCIGKPTFSFTSQLRNLNLNGFSWNLLN